MFAIRSSKRCKDEVASLKEQLARQTEQYRLQSAKLTAIHRSMASIEFDPNGIVLDANDNFLRTMGYTRAEIVGQHHRIFVHPSDAESPGYQQFWDRLRRGDYFSAEFRRIDKSGREVWIEASYNPVLDAYGRVASVIKFASDVSEKKHQSVIGESKLHAIDRSFATIEFTLDGMIVDANSNFLMTMGYTRNEIMNRHHRMFVPNSVAESAAYESFWQELRNGRYHSGLFHRIGKGDRDIFILASYNPIFGLNGEISSVIKYAMNVTDAELNRKKNVRVSRSLANSVTAIRSSIDQISRNVEETSELSVDAELLSKNTLSIAQNLGDGSRKIGQVVGVIEDLAEQTNLLALNATIESARAGDSGKGFAVVATEVKALAHQTAIATKGIAATIAEIQNCISQVIDSTSKISNSVSTVNSNMTTISTSVNDQASTMAAVAQNAQDLYIEPID